MKRKDNGYFMVWAMLKRWLMAKQVWRNFLLFLPKKKTDTKTACYTEKVFNEDKPSVTYITYYVLKTPDFCVIHSHS